MLASATGQSKGREKEHERERPERWGLVGCATSSCPCRISLGSAHASPAPLPRTCLRSRLLYLPRVCSRGNHAVSSAWAGTEPGRSTPNSARSGAAQVNESSDGDAGGEVEHNGSLPHVHRVHMRRCLRASVSPAPAYAAHMNPHTHKGGATQPDPELLMRLHHQARHIRSLTQPSSTPSVCVRGFSLTCLL